MKPSERYQAWLKSDADMTFIDWLRYGEPEPDTEPGYCPSCSGSGEGMYDGSTCHRCGGSGERKPLLDDPYDY